ncbi:hypothetical protein ACKKBF_B34145 [Auxenochlorella protothecoides x Auxenochlorella symbiontica]
MSAPASNGSPFSSWGEGGSKEQPGPGTAAPATPLSPAWLLALPPVMLGSLEIGLYNTTGTTAQAWGLEVTGATRSAFLIQASALFTPMLAAVGGQRLTTNAWLGSALGLAGTLAVVGDTTQGGAGFGAGVSGGDLLTLGAAAAYSAATVRIPVYARRVQPLQLALGKSLFLGAVSCAALGLQVQQHQAHLWHGWHDGWQGWAAIAWSASGPGALAAYLHVQGQSSVDAVTAQIAFSAVPLWSALLTALLLPGDSAVGPLTWAGGGCMVIAGVVGVLPPKPTPAEAKK